MGNSGKEGRGKGGKECRRKRVQGEGGAGVGESGAGSGGRERMGWDEGGAEGRAELRGGAE